MNKRIEELEAQCWETRNHPVSQAAMGDQFNTEKFAELIVRELVGTFRVDDSTDGFYYNEFNDSGCIILRFYVDGDPLQMQGEKIDAGTHYSTCRLNERFVDHLMKETFGVEK